MQLQGHVSPAVDVHHGLVGAGGGVEGNALTYGGDLGVEVLAWGLGDNEAAAGNGHVL